MDGGYPKQEGGGGGYNPAPPQQQFVPEPHQFGPPPDQYSPHVDDVTREHSACQKQFNPGDETYRCITCEATDDTPGNHKYFFKLSSVFKELLSFMS